MKDEDESEQLLAARYVSLGKPAKKDDSPLIKVYREIYKKTPNVFLKMLQELERDYRLIKKATQVSKADAGTEVCIKLVDKLICEITGTPETLGIDYDIPPR